MTAKSIELIKYQNRRSGSSSINQILVEYLYFPTPFQIQEADTIMVFTSGASFNTELVMTCEPDKLNYAVSCLDSVIRQQRESGFYVSFMSGEDFVTTDCLGRMYSMIDITDNSAALDITEYFLLRDKEKQLLQVCWTNVLGEYPYTASYDHELSPQPILR